MEHQQHRIVAGQRPHDVRTLHVVQCKGRRVGHTVQRFQNGQILCIFHRQHALPEDGTQLLLEVQPRFLLRHGIAVVPAPVRHLQKVQLLDVPGHGRLGAGEPTLGQKLHQLLLGLHRLLFDDL